MNWQPNDMTRDCIKQNTTKQLAHIFSHPIMQCGMGLSS